MPSDVIVNDELILRHIPGGSTWQAPGPRITSANFKLRTDRGETGVSVSRSEHTTPEELLARVGGRLDAGSRVAEARVGEIRTLGLDVVSVPLPDDPGHAEIRSASASLDEQNVRRKLAKLFFFLDMESSTDES